MAVTSISRDQNNVCIVRMTSSDMLDQISSSNYISQQQPTINALNDGGFNWLKSDMVLVAASDSNGIFQFTDDTFSTLIQYGATGSGTVNPGTANELSWYVTDGNTVSGLPTEAISVLVTNNVGIPSWETTLPAGLEIPGYLLLSGGTMTGSLILAHDPTAPLEAATKQYVDDGMFLPLSGGTMTGPLILDGDPISTDQAANKHYVDTGLNTKLNLSGGTMTGNLFLNVNPTSPLQAATKQYVDNSEPTFPITLAQGGTSASLTPNNGGVFYSTSSSAAITNGTPTNNQIFLSGSNGPPSWSNTIFPSSTVQNQLLYSASNNFIAGLTTANNGILITGVTGTPSIGTTLPSTVQSNITSVGTITSGTWNGSLIGSTYGGTGVSNPTAHGLMIAEGASAMTSLVLGNNQLPLGQTAGDPVATSLISGTNMDIEYSSGSITFNSVPNTVITVTDSSTPINIPVDSDIFYLIEVAYGDNVTFNLPVTPATRRQTLTFQCGTGGFTIAQGTVSGSQRILYNGTQSTPGPGHGIQSGNNTPFFTDGIVMINYDLNNVVWIAFQPTGTPELY